MKRTLIAVLLSVAVASTASAASLSINFDQTSYMPGDVVTITLEGSVDGEQAPAVLVTLESNGNITWTGATQDTVFASFAGGLPFSAFPTECPRGPAPTQCTAMNQANGNILSPVAVDAVSGVFATITGVAVQSGIIDVRTINASGDNTFFGVPNGTVFGTVNVVPEPGTAALFGLGLMGLGFAGRRR